MGIGSDQPLVEGDRSLLTWEILEGIHATSAEMAVDGPERGLLGRVVSIFGATVTLLTGLVIPTRWIGEQHVREDLGRGPGLLRRRLGAEEDSPSVFHRRGVMW